MTAPTLSPALSAQIADARAVNEAFDRLLLSGLARLNPSSRAALDELAGALQSTPLGPAMTQAVAALASGELLAQHLGVIAAARASIEGALTDALLDSAIAAAGLVREEPQLRAAPKPDATTSVLMESVRQWLVEIGLAGLGQLDHAMVAPVIDALRTVQGHPPLRRLAALVTGFAHELLAACPTASLSDPPARRWADLWSTALLATFALPDEPERRAVTGTLTPLGADIRDHDHMVSLVVHALLVEGDARRLVRVNLSAWKVDAIDGPELFTLLEPLAPELIAALAGSASVVINGHTLLGSGDLSWDGKAKAAAGSPLAAALPGALITAPAPRDRHPLQIAVPVVGDTAIAYDAAARPFTSRHAELGEDTFKGTKGFVGLWRWDDGFALQPLALGAKKGVRGFPDGFAKTAKIKARATDVLEERASRLLRK